MKRENYGMLSGFLGIGLNIALFIFKLIYSAKANSLSLQADAFNNLMDIISSLLVVLGFGFSSMREDKEHPFGHGRMEQISGLAISMIIIFTGMELAKSSVERIFNPEALISSPAVYVVLIVSILGKILISVFNFILGKKIDSTTLIVNAKDSSSDVIATLAVLMSLVIFDITGKSYDGWAGLIVSIMILYAGFQAAKETISPLIGESLSLEEKEKISKFILDNSDIVGVHDIMIHSYGVNLSILTLHAEVNANHSLCGIHEQVDMLERKIKKRWGYRTLIHVDPISADDSLEYAKTKEILAEILKEIDPRIEFHDFSLHNRADKIKLIFDVYAPYDLKLKNSDLVQKIEDSLRLKLGDSYVASMDVERE